MLLALLEDEEEEDEEELEEEDDELEESELDEELEDDEEEDDDEEVDELRLRELRFLSKGTGGSAALGGSAVMGLGTLSTAGTFPESTEGFLGLESELEEEEEELSDELLCLLDFVVKDGEATVSPTEVSGGDAILSFLFSTFAIMVQAGLSVSVKASSFGDSLLSLFWSWNITSDWSSPLLDAAVVSEPAGALSSLGGDLLHSSRTCSVCAGEPLLLGKSMPESLLLGAISFFVYPDCSVSGLPSTLSVCFSRSGGDGDFSFVETTMPDLCGEVELDGEAERLLQAGLSVRTGERSLF